MFQFNYQLKTICLFSDLICFFRDYSFIFLYLKETKPIYIDYSAIALYFFTDIFRKIASQNQLKDLCALSTCTFSSGLCFLINAQYQYL
jgi:hypothetical protein